MNDHTIPRLELTPGSLWLMRRDAHEGLRSRRVPPPAAQEMAAASRGLRALTDPECDPDAPSPFSFFDSFKLDVRDGVAVIPVRGPLTFRANPADLCMNWAYGGECYDVIEAKVRAAVRRADVRGIILDIDSPGGTVPGIAALSAAIRAAADAKPLKAFVSGWACSAAYWIACSAPEIVAGPGSEVGSIGTILVVVDDSAMLDKLGIKEIVFKSKQSPMKWPDAATEEGRAAIQDDVDRHGAEFVAAVAKGRGVPEKKVLADFGQGGCLTAEAGKKAGMVDRLGTLDDLITKMAGTGRRRGVVKSASRPPAKPAAPTAASTPNRSSPTMSLRAKMLSLFASAPEGGPDLTDEEKLQALDIAGQADAQAARPAPAPAAGAAPTDEAAQLRQELARSRAETIVAKADGWYDAAFAANRIVPAEKAHALDLFIAASADDITSPLKDGKTRVAMLKGIYDARTPHTLDQASTGDQALDTEAAAKAAAAAGGRVLDHKAADAKAPPTEARVNQLVGHLVSAGLIGADVLAK